MAIAKIEIGKKPYYNIDPISKGMTVADACIDGFIDEAENITRRVGLSQFADTATGVKGQGIYFWEQIDRMVVVTGGKCYLMDSYGNLTDISGDIVFNSIQPIVFSAGNKVDGSPWLYMADGGYPICTTGSDCVRIGPSTGSPANVSHVAWLASRFLILEANSRKVYATDTDPATGEIENDYFLAAENPLTAEVLPDNLKAIFADWDELYFWGSQGLEIWRDDGNFFSPIDGAFSPVGLLAAHSIARADNTVFALCTVDGGMKRAVIKMVGSPQRAPQVLSLPIERILNAYATVDDAIGFLTNNSEYVITFPTQGVTWAYNYVTDVWQQWSRWNTLTASREEFIGRYSAYAWGKLFMLSRVDGKVYHADRQYFDDAGDIARAEYITGNIDHGTSLNKRNMFLRFKVKRGATTSYTDAPSIMVRWRDNGKNAGDAWDKEKLIDIGTQGQREFYYTMYALGMYRSRQYSFVMTDADDMVISEISESVEAMGV